MLKIRLFRIGKKHQPVFRVIVTDKKNPPQGGRFLEILGFWNPLTKEKKLKTERIKYWLSVGAKPSDTVYNLLVSEKIIIAKKIGVHKKAKKDKKKDASVSVSVSASSKATADKPADKPAEKSVSAEAMADKPVSAEASAGKEEKSVEESLKIKKEETTKQEMLKEEKKEQEAPKQEKPS